MLRAVIFVPSNEFDPHAGRCTQHCEDQDYELAGIVRDDWPTVARMLSAGEVDVVVVSSETHLDPRRLPRIEVVAQQPTCGRRISPWEQRTRVIRRGAGA